ncbi:MAG: methyltransferase domain-containing protein [Rhodocyclaceae bacterium]
MNRWDAADYARHSAGQERWGRELIAQLELRPTDDVLDIGCGDGRLTAAIAAQTTGCVLGVDSSADMIRHATEHHAGGHLRFEVTDAAHLSYEAAFSRVFSNAALHWVPGAHAHVVAGVARALRPDGQALLQMGGRGNGEGIIAAFDAIKAGAQWRGYFVDFVFPYGFHAPDDYREWATQAGLLVRQADLLLKDMTYTDRTSFVGWLRTAWLPFVEPVPAGMREAYLEQVADAYLAAHAPDDAGVIHVTMRRLQVRLAKPR